MKEIKHVFVQVVERPEDPFGGVKSYLKEVQDGKHSIFELVLPDSYYETIRDVEYSGKKYFRFLFYKNIFRELNRSLKQLLDSLGSDLLSVVYFSDEGVWSEFIRLFRLKYTYPNIIYVNVQHGFEHLKRVKYKSIRKLVNIVFYKLFGFPVYGMGCFGGSGSGVYDIYLTYDEKTASFIRRQTNDLSYPCPTLIKKNLIDRYASERKRLSEVQRKNIRALFALQPYVLGASLKCGPRGVFEELLPLAKLFFIVHKSKLILRIHPGMDKNSVIEIFNRSEISKYAEIDPEIDLVKSLAKVSVVLSYSSTVLWEALLLGLLPISVKGNCFEGDLEFQHETVHLYRNFESNFIDLLKAESINKYKKNIRNYDFNWSAVINYHNKTELTMSIKRDLDYFYK